MTAKPKPRIPTPEAILDAGRRSPRPTTGNPVADVVLERRAELEPNAAAWPAGEPEDVVGRPPLVRIALAFGAMPYGGIARFRTFKVSNATRPEEVLELVAENLENLRDTLRTVAAGNQAERDELYHLRALLAGADTLDVLLAKYRADAEELEEAARAAQAEELDATHRFVDVAPEAEAGA